MIREHVHFMFDNLRGGLLIRLLIIRKDIVPIPVGFLIPPTPNMPTPFGASLIFLKRLRTLQI